MQDHNANTLKVRLKEYLRPAPNRGFYICPICGSGTGPNKTGALRVSPDGLHAKCFACDFYGDIFDIIGAEFHLDAAESYKKVADLFGQGHDIPVRPPDDTQVHPASQPPDSHQFDHYLADAARSLNNSPVALSYLKKRGFSRETIRRYRLGYDVNARQIVIPYGDTGYFIRRGVGEGKTFYKPPTAQAGPEPLFNEPALDTADCVFVVESQLCALSVQQVGGAAVALGGAGTRLHPLHGPKG